MMRKTFIRCIFLGVFGATQLKLEFHWSD